MQNTTPYKRKITTATILLLITCLLFSNMIFITTFATPAEFVLTGDWEQVWGSGEGMFSWAEQNGRVVTFTGEECNLWSPLDRYTKSNFTDDGFDLNITGLLGGDPGYRVKIVDNNKIEVYQGNALVFKLNRISETENSYESYSPSNEPAEEIVSEPEYDEADNEVFSQNVRFSADISVDLDWGWNLFDKNASEYDHNLAMAGIILNRAAYDGREATYNKLKDLKFDVIDSFNFESTRRFENPAFAVAAKKITMNSETKIIIAVVTCGSQSGTGDFPTDLIDGYGGGFATSASNTYKRIKALFSSIELKYGCKLSKENTIFFLTGHSLGGAVSGILSDKLLSHANQNKIFTYTFASVNYNTEENDYTKYTNVHNIINSNDGFRHYPFGLGYKRYGQDWWYDYKDYEEESKEIHKKLGIEEDAHSTETYLACLLSGLPKNMGNGVSTSYNLSSIHCPVDISVYDNKGNKLGYTSGSDAIIEANNEIFICVQGSSKYIVSPPDKKYKIEFVATDKGTMTYTQATIDEFSNEVIEEKTFSNVKLETGKSMMTEIGKGIDAESVKLFVQDENDNVIAEIDTNGQENAERGNGANMLIIVIVGIIVIVLAVLFFIKKRR